MLGMLAQAQPGAHHGAPAVHAPAREREGARPRSGVPAVGSRDRAARSRRARHDLTGERGARRVRQDHTHRHIEDSTLPDEPWFRRVLAEYFPPTIAERFADDLHNHPLHREIITTGHRQRHDQPRWGDLSSTVRIEETGAAGDGDHAGVQGGPRDLRPAGALGATSRRLDNGWPTAAQHAGLPRDPPADRPGHPLVRRHPVPDQRPRRARSSGSGPRCASLGHALRSCSAAPNGRRSTTTRRNWPISACPRTCRCASRNC